MRRLGRGLGETTALQAEGSFGGKENGLELGRGGVCPIL